MEKSLSYDDVSLVAKYYDYNGRSDIPTDVELGGYTFKLPVIPANMKCVIDFERAEWLAKNGYFYIMHRFEPHDKIHWWAKEMNKKKLLTSISVGVSEKDKQFLEPIKKMKIKLDFITIDIAHGHCKMMKEMIQYIKELFPISPFIIAGNVMTKQAVRDLKSWGADCVKVGIGPGASCTTKLKTGFHSPMFSTVFNCSRSCFSSEEMKSFFGPHYFGNREIFEDIFDDECWDAEFKRVFEEKEEYVKQMQDIPIIADGGVRYNGDIFKAIVAGAKMVMAGSLFSACEDSPAENVYDHHGHLVGKQYYGSASEYNKGHKKNVEGTLIQLDYNGMTYEEKLQEIKEDLQSSISYSGNSSLKNVGEVEFVVLK